jgi:hypothetical protein
MSIYLLSASLSHEEITKMVSKIKEERVGVGLDILEGTPNPFAIVKEVVKEEPKEEEVKVKPKPIIRQEESYKLTAILNHRAFINKKWYSIGAKLGTYRVYSIGNSSVKLRRGREVKRLVIEERKKKFSIFKGH